MTPSPASPPLNDQCPRSPQEARRLINGMAREQLDDLTVVDGIPLTRLTPLALHQPRQALHELMSLHLVNKLANQTSYQDCEAKAMLFHIALERCKLGYHSGIDPEQFREVISEILCSDHEWRAYSNTTLGGKGGIAAERGLKTLERQIALHDPMHQRWTESFDSQGKARNWWQTHDHWHDQNASGTLLAALIAVLEEHHRGEGVARATSAVHEWQQRKPTSLSLKQGPSERRPHEMLIDDNMYPFRSGAIRMMTRIMPTSWMLEHWSGICQQIESVLGGTSLKRRANESIMATLNRATLTTLEIELYANGARKAARISEETWVKQVLKSPGLGNVPQLLPRGSQTKPRIRELLEESSHPLAVNLLKENQTDPGIISNIEEASLARQWAMKSRLNIPQRLQEISRFAPNCPINALVEMCQAQVDIENLSWPHGLLQATSTHSSGMRITPLPTTPLQALVRRLSGMIWTSPGTIADIAESEVTWSQVKQEINHNQQAWHTLAAACINATPIRMLEAGMSAPSIARNASLRASTLRQLIDKLGILPEIDQLTLQLCLLHGDDLPAIEHDLTCWAQRLTSTRLMNISPTS